LLNSWNVGKWKAISLTERSAAQSHFIDLCEVLGQQHPAAADHVGDTFTFEKHVSKLHGGKGFADVWKRGFFAWEYKGKHRDLVAAYHQLADYRDDLENPPLLVVCDMDVFEVHTSFTGTQTRVYRFKLDDLLATAPTPNCALPPLDVLRALFTDPDKLRPEEASKRVTEAAAAEFAKLAASLRQRGIDSERAAHFLMRLLFCLFADSIGLLPDNLFRKLLSLERGRAASFSRKLRQLFASMSTSGSNFGMYDIHYFNGGLFADDEAFDLTEADLTALRAAADLDWSTVEPAIFGTLFERSLDPSKRSQLGAHYTSKEDILLIVEPVVMAPRRERGDHLLDTNRPLIPSLTNGFADWQDFGFSSMAVEAAKWRGAVLTLNLSVDDPAATRRGFDKYRKKWEASLRKWYECEVLIELQQAQRKSRG